MPSLIVNKIKILILLRFSLKKNNKCEEIKQDSILTKKKLSPFLNSLNKIKELFDLIMSKISSDGGDFPRIIEITLLNFYRLYKLVLL